MEIAPSLTCTGITTAPLVACGTLLNEFNAVDNLKLKLQNQSVVSTTTYFDGTLDVDDEVTTTTSLNTNSLVNPTFNPNVLCGTLTGSSTMACTSLSLTAPSLASGSTKNVANLYASQVTNTSIDLKFGKSSNFGENATLSYFTSSTTPYASLQLSGGYNTALTIYSNYITVPSACNIYVNSLTTPVKVLPYISTSVTLPTNTYLTSIYTFDAATTELNIEFTDVGVDIGGNVYFQIGYGSSTAFTSNYCTFNIPWSTGVTSASDVYPSITGEYILGVGNTLTGSLVIRKVQAATSSKPDIWMGTSTSTTFSSTASAIQTNQAVITWNGPSNNIPATWFRCTLFSNSYKFASGGTMKIVSC